ncbi:MAG: hypothetical protein U1E26_03070 [Coriobacteriia bacterium]|nr:hypothetical protein [Coriobacteriia bacterium]
MRRLAHFPIIAAALLAALLVLPASAHAVPSAEADKAAAIEAKKAEEAEARVQIEQMRLDLGAAVAEYIELGRDIERARADVSQVTTELAAMQLELEAAEEALTRRAVEMYRGERTDMLRLLFTSKTLQDLWARSTYLAMIGQRDVRIISDVRLARSENLWLQDGMYKKLDRLSDLQQRADEQRSRIESDMAAQELRAAQLKVDLARLMWEPTPGVAVSEDGFNPNTVISEQVYRDAASMTVEQVQEFLESQPGTLARYRAKDHAGVEKSAAQMIHEASVRWGVSPKVVMATLQKEQSLLTRGKPSQTAYDWAMGCGKTDSRTFTKYKGFGMQIWCGAEKLANLGKGWRPGMSMKIDGSVIHPSNPATYGLFRYTPHFSGTMSFWMIYWRYFGDPGV